jgi:hypothetical protein
VPNVKLLEPSAPIRLLILLLPWVWIASVHAADADAADADDDSARRYTYSWQFTDDDAMRPRGGTTRGPEPTLATTPSEAWSRLTEPDLTSLERDRRAVLAMAGGYRTTFDFIETLGFSADYQPGPPYQSWATEYVYVVADQPRFISLQHILVMRFLDQDGSLSEPMVTKHWRQDWRYEDRNLHVYAGNGHWQRRELPAARVAGSWSQAVFQVDDSPRYQAIGRWQHHGNHATWTSDHTWRPLPRRESSVRDDYNVLAGTNRVTITPQGWIHEEDNLKLVLDAHGRADGAAPYLAREAGLNRYRHIVGYDFSAGDEYWRRTGPFWGEVRQAWEQIFTKHDQFSMRSRVDGEPLFGVMFGLAERYAGKQAFQADDARSRIDAALERYIQPE